MEPQDEVVLRSKKNVMLDGEMDEQVTQPNPMMPTPQDTAMYVAADDSINEEPKRRMGDILRSHTPEKVEGLELTNEEKHGRTCE